MIPVPSVPPSSRTSKAVAQTKKGNGCASRHTGLSALCLGDCGSKFEFSNRLVYTIVESVVLAGKFENRASENQLGKTAKRYLSVLLAMRSTQQDSVEGKGEQERIVCTATTQTPTVTLDQTYAKQCMYREHCANRMYLTL